MELWVQRRADLDKLEKYYSIDDVLDMREALEEWDDATERLRERRERGDDDEVVGGRVPSGPGPRGLP